jgi:hypothetical protein
VFGGVQRNSKAFAQIIPNRTKTTLLAVIKKRIRLGTLIISDEWAAYRCLSNAGYQHETIRHKRRFFRLVIFDLF